MPGDPEAARVDACFALIAALDDTNLLHRGGQAGLAFARATARAFVAQRRLSLGGATAPPPPRSRPESRNRHA
ncbi:hypothetical protein WL38_25890 [Burkholderia ubonensis]|nr:hypothetical protein WK76_23805 [Burkholderia ubonensis]KWB61275.1 hypothetical protein WL38_25890 [Burkholderia ubonensis]